MSIAGPTSACRSARRVGETVCRARGAGASHNDWILVCARPSTRKRAEFALRRRLLFVTDLDQDIVHEAQLLRLLGGEIAIAFGLGLDDLERPARVLGKDLV